MSSFYHFVIRCFFSEVGWLDGFYYEILGWIDFIVLLGVILGEVKMGWKVGWVSR
jgi:hypothetical protein